MHLRTISIRSSTNPILKLHTTLVKNLLNDPGNHQIAVTSVEEQALDSSEFFPIPHVVFTLICTMSCMFQNYSTQRAKVVFHAKKLQKLPTYFECFILSQIM